MKVKAYFTICLAGLMISLLATPAVYSATFTVTAGNGPGLLNEFTAEEVELHKALIKFIFHYAELYNYKTYNLYCSNNLTAFECAVNGRRRNIPYNMEKTTYTFAQLINTLRQQT
ncbi:MAG: hypothetical protein QW270_00115 [Candidatus Bathyarchaeia archaeon]